MLKKKGLKRNPSATNSYRMAKFLLKLGCGRNFIYLPGNRKIKPAATATMKLNIFLGSFGIRLLDHVFFFELPTI